MPLNLKILGLEKLEEFLNLNLNLLIHYMRSANGSMADSEGRKGVGEVFGDDLY